MDSLLLTVLVRAASEHQAGACVSLGVQVLKIKTVRGGFCPRVAKLQMRESNTYVSTCTFSFLRFRVRSLGTPEGYHPNYTLGHL